MNLLEEAIIYATIMHQGQTRKFGTSPFILHPMEVAQIMASMTDDQELISAAILHDILENTDGSAEEIEKRFGKRVAFLVSQSSENAYPGIPPADTWMVRKKESLRILENSTDIGVQMLWLADQLANIRSLAGVYSERGEAMWQDLHQVDSDKQCWYYRSVAENVELVLNKTGAFKELIRHINSIWPGTFDSEKARYRKYREVSVDGCRLIGRGAKGEVYRYNDELVIKVYNQNNTYRDVEREISFARRAFVLGMPTAISFGIVSVGDCYGSMYELVDANTISSLISKSPGQVDNYAKIMADLAKMIHEISVDEDDEFPDVADRLRDRIRDGIALDDAALAAKCLKLVNGLPQTHTLVHGDFHTGNVFLQNGEPLLIDMDRVSQGHPITEIADLYNSYVILGEDDPAVVENFMGFSYATAQRFFDTFLRDYLGTDDAARLREVTDKAAILCLIRKLNRIHRKGMSALTETDHERIRNCLERLTVLTDRYDTLVC